MKLSDLVGYLNTLDTLSVQATATETIGELKKIVKIVEDSRVQVPDALGSLNES